LTEADIDDMIADVDTDGSGWVDYNGQFLLNPIYTIQPVVQPVIKPVGQLAVQPVV